MNGFFHDLPPSLAAVAVSVVGDSTSLRLLDLAELFSQCGPIFHTLQAFEASSQHPSEFALVVFHDKAAAAAACELFMGYPISSTCSLEVQYAPRQALQRLAQMLVKCMQSADFVAELRSASPGHPAEPFPRPASSPAFPTHSNRVLPADWQQQQLEQQQEQLQQPHVPPTSFPPSQLPRSGPLASSSQHHRELAAAAVAAWGAPPGASHGVHPQQPPPLPPPQPAQERVLDRVLEPSAGIQQLGRPLADPWDVTHPLSAARTADPPASGPWGRLPTAAPPAAAGQQLPGEVQQQQHIPLAQHHHQQQPSGLPAAAAGAEGAPIPPMAELARLQLSATALRKQQEAFLAAAQQSQQRQGGHAVPAPQQQPYQHQQQQAAPAGYAAVAAAAMPPPPPPPAAPPLAKGAWGAGAPTHIPQPTSAAASAEPLGSFARSLAGVPSHMINHVPQQQAATAQEGWEEVGRRSATARRSSAGVSVASSIADQDVGGSLGPADGLGRRLYIKNLRQDVKPQQLEAVFRRYGTIEECAKLPDATHAFITFQNESQAAMAFAELNEEMLPALCAGSTPLWIEFREAPNAAAQGSPRKGLLAAGALGCKPASVVSSGVGASRTQPYAAVPSSAATAAAQQPQGQLAQHHFPPQQRREEEASQPTTKLWVGGICGTAREETLKKIFGKFGSVYGIELRPAPEPGRRDQWAFVNFRNKVDCMKARDELVDKVIPELTGNMRLKLRYKEPGTGPQDRKRTGGR